MKHFDYLISGAGVSGLMLAYRMALDADFSGKSILMIDAEDKKTNDHVWCYWEKDSDIWDAIVSKRWKTILFASKAYTSTNSIVPYQYKMIHSKTFYKHIWNVLDCAKNISFKKEKVQEIQDQKDKVVVTTESNRYTASKVFNSILLNQKYKSCEKFPLINQHFVGWSVETAQPVFDPEVATFMDFNLPQKGNTRFMYVLPTTPNKALLEYTLFSKDHLAVAEYETAIQIYLKNLGVTDYQIMEKEQGSIPMTSYRFNKQNSENILQIGTAGGWTKGSTGYTFKNATKHTATLIKCLKTNQSLQQFPKRTKYWYYDLLLLDILSKHNEQGAYLFSSMFKNNKVVQILKFLDEETSLIEDIRIMISMPQLPFIKALLSRIKGVFNL